MSLQSFFRFRKIGVRGLSGFTTFRRRVLTESGIRAILAPFRQVTNLRRRFGRGISLEKFLPGQITSRGSLPSLLGFGIGGTAYAKVFGKTGPMARAKAMYARRKRLTQLSNYLGPLKQFTGRRRLKVPKLPTLSTAFRKFRTLANKIKTPRPRRTSSKVSTAKSAGPRTAPGVSKKTVSSAVRSAILKTLNQGIRGTVAVPGSKTGVSFTIAPPKPLKKLGQNTKLGVTFSGKGSKPLQSALAALDQNRNTATGKAIASAFNQFGPSGISRAVSRIPSLTSIRARQTALKTLATRGGKAANRNIASSLAKQSRKAAARPKTPRSPTGPKGPKGPKAPRGPKGPSTTPTKKPKSAGKTLLSKGQRVLRQLQGRLRSGDIKNIFFPRRDPRRGKPGKRGGRTF